MTHPHQTLSEQVEQLVREHIEAVSRTAIAAVERACSSSPPRPRAARAKAQATFERRAPTEVAALGERLYEAVCAQPGETMSVLGPELGKTARELHRPMRALKRAGRVRSVGQRQQTRYYPTVTTASANAS